MTLLIIAAALLPLMWGWAVYWLMAKLWPQTQSGGPRGGDRHPTSPPPLDYQI